jgi:carotenoid cleavage dioxygenase-like enzyme
MSIPARPVVAGEELAIWSWNNWRPSAVEEDYEISQVEGEIPADLHGTLYRNGPSQRMQPGGDYTKLHFFDGDGLVHAFRISDGRAWYRNRFVRHPGFLAEQAAGRANQYFIGPRVADPDPSIAIRRQANTHVVRFAGRVLAMWEAGLPFEIDARTLDPIGDFDFGGQLLGPWASAHPKIDGRTGQMLIHGYFVAEPFLQVHVVETDGRVSFAAPVDVGYPAFLHDLAITENYFVVPVHPIVLEVPWVDGRPVGTYGEWMAWRPDRGLRFAVVDRATGATRWFTAPTPQAIFHVGNAFEENGKIHLDAFLYRDGERKLEAMRRARDGVWIEGTGAYPFAFELDLASGRCSERRLSDRPGEWPRIDERRVGYRNRWGYAIEAERDFLILANSPLRVLKYDREGGGGARHDFGPGLFPAEPVFVPRRGGRDEDDGYVLTLVYDGPRDASFLAILDARHMADRPLAKLHLRHRVPAGFHGSWAEGVF